MFDKHRNKSRQAPAMGSDAPAAPAPPQSPVAKAAVIGPGIEIEGSIGGSENLLVEGHIRGSIELPAYEVTIGKSGVVKADINGRVVRVAGQVTGDLTGEEKVIISGSGNVRGNIKAPRVVLEDGAMFKGSIDMDPGDRAANVTAVGNRAAAKPAALGATAEAGKSPDLALKSS